MIDIVLKRFESPDEIRTFDKGKFEIVKIGGMTIGRATYQPGWKWSEDVAPLAGTAFCETEHVGMVVSGTATPAFPNGEIHELSPRQPFYVPPPPTISSVLGINASLSL